MHAHQIVHYDLKPPNILLDAHDTAVICDFGIANVVGLDASAPRRRLAAGLRQPRSVGMTAAYASPELFERLMRGPASRTEESDKASK